MKLYSTIRVDTHGPEMLEQPVVLARIRRGLGGAPDLTSSRMRAAMEAATVVDAHTRALYAVGATDALALVVDDLVLFEDRVRLRDDLGDLFLAFHDYAPAIDTDFGALRLTVEHREAGLHYLVELQLSRKDEPSIRVIVSARSAAYEPRAWETAEVYRRRVEPMVRSRRAQEVAAALFEDFVARLRAAITRALPGAHTTILASPAEPTARRRRPQCPDDPQYDPHEVHYPNPMFGMFAVPC